MTEVIVHAGFHKTGTTSVQRFLQANAPALKPHVTLGLNYQARDLIQTALPDTRIVTAALEDQGGARGLVRRRHCLTCWNFPKRSCRGCGARRRPIKRQTQRRWGECWR